MVGRVPVAGIITKILLEPYLEIATLGGARADIPAIIQLSSGNDQGLSAGYCRYFPTQKGRLKPPFSGRRVTAEGRRLNANEKNPGNGQLAAQHSLCTINHA